MKTKFNNPFCLILMLLFTAFSLTNVIAQEKSKKQLKEERKLEKQKQIELLVNSKEFVFTVERVIPQSGRSINTTTEYTVEFRPDYINSQLPFFGRGYSGIGYGGDGGMVFEGKPTFYTIEKMKKAFQIKTEVKGKNDSFSLMLSVSFEGNAYLTITSNNRSPISYDGELESFKKK